MKIHKLEFAEGAKEAKGLAVVIDVFRATTVASYLLESGASRVYPLATPEEAFALKQEMTDALLVGERGGVPVPGFDLGNSPTKVMEFGVASRTAIHSTTNGTVCLANAAAAPVRMVGSFVNIQATVDYILSQKPTEVSLVASHHTTGNKCAEDELCADSIEMMLCGKTPDWRTVYEQIKNSRNGRKFFDPEVSWATPEDFECCLKVDYFHHAVIGQYDSNQRFYLSLAE